MVTKFGTAFAVGTIAFVALTGCGGGNEKEAGRTGAGEETTGRSPVQTSSPTPSGEALPMLEVGKPLPVNLSNSGTDESSTASEQFTLKKIDRFKTYTDRFTDETQRAQNGEFVCLVLDIKNVGTAEGDTYTSAHWVGADGKVVSSIDTIGGVCEAKGLPDSILGQDSPGPGQYISGTISYDVPTDQPGAIAVEDRNGMLLFRINYAPESATVKVTQ